ncbi:MAG: ATP-binding protein [Firmicutes bacterium]|nr:ATP-binding protein [Bacillota bacterium]
MIKRIDNYIYKTKLALNSLSIYRGILEDNVISRLNLLISHTHSIVSNAYFMNNIRHSDTGLETFINLYNGFYFHLLEKNYKNLKDYIIDRIIYDENAFSRDAEANIFKNINYNIVDAVKNDLSKLQLVSNLSSQIMKECILKYCNISEFEKPIVENLPSWDNKLETTPMTTLGTKSTATYVSNCNSQLETIRNKFYLNEDWSKCIEDLAHFHATVGCGIFARYRAFIWEYKNNFGYLRGIENPDPITLSELIGYNEERMEVINNTLQFLKGFPANNVLLYGDRGTGKSSTVKAILNEYYEKGLRMIEIPKNYIADFPQIIRLLKGRKNKFIIFIDDLSFEDSTENYTALKAALEGSLESKPSNVLIYATSNRRHLIKEKFSDRIGLQSSFKDDEVRAVDTMQEKLSLSDRFGITVVFSTPDRQKYLDIVEGIARQRGLVIDKDLLHKEALKWELWYNGRSPRTARQFVDWLQGHLSC